MAGPLAGYRIIEIAGIGPGPFAAMMLADHGAEVIRIDRPGADADRGPLLRSRRSVVLDLKTPAGVRTLRSLCRRSHGLIEGFRPGVMERLRIGPDVLLGDNPGLVYGRMTGWGQSGPRSPRVGHDINYIAVSGVLGAIGRAGERPVPPLNLAGDFGGGAMMMAFGMVSALLAVKSGAPGQVIDCAMTDGSALLMAMMWGFRADGLWRDERGSNVLDTGAPFYDVYQTADGACVAIGAIEPAFYQALLQGLALTDDPLFSDPSDRSVWPEQRARLTAVFLTKARGEWETVFHDSDACMAPVLTMGEALDDEHNKARATFIEVGGVVQPAPAPRYSRTPCPPPSPPRRPGEDQAWLENMLAVGEQDTLKEMNRAF